MVKSMQLHSKYSIINSKKKKLLHSHTLLHLLPLHQYKFLYLPLEWTHTFLLPHTFTSTVTTPMHASLPLTYSLITTATTCTSIIIPMFANVTSSSLFATCVLKLYVFLYRALQKNKKLQKSTQT